MNGDARLRLREWCVASLVAGSLVVALIALSACGLDDPLPERSSSLGPVEARAAVERMIDGELPPGVVFERFEERGFTDLVVDIELSVPDAELPALLDAFEASPPEAAASAPGRMRDARIATVSLEGSTYRQGRIVYGADLEQSGRTFAVVTASSS